MWLRGTLEHHKQQLESISFHKWVWDGLHLQKNLPQMTGICSLSRIFQIIIVICSLYLFGPNALWEFMAFFKISLCMESGWAALVLSEISIFLEQRTNLQVSITAFGAVSMLACASEPWLACFFHTWKQVPLYCGCTSPAVVKQSVTDFGR